MAILKCGEREREREEAMEKEDHLFEGISERARALARIITWYRVMRSDGLFTYTKIVREWKK